MQPIYSVQLHLPEDKLPGYYAQIVKGIADTVTLLDRDKTLLFVHSLAEAEAIEAFVAKYNVTCEYGQWVQLDDTWSIQMRTFTDYGLITRSENRFLDLALASVVSLSPGTAPDAELALAAEQADEHALAWQTQNDGQRLIAVDRHQTALIAGIARAYRCSSSVVLAAAD
ncbi:hypothetical protein [Paenibacillus montanisoli]|uniref:Uncharacterized protein n=1 Tax=Paenibacillus montanisoli TaxID=2081970 RepID=A0A328U6U5_9BACL|nr:hypothetical protein [Paenibacillus montanisoli]RAP76675.1 hypothetical protein DL346_15080 [Paenibacillus montanisoli]